MVDIKNLKGKIKDICEKSFDFTIEFIFPKWLPLVFILSIIILYTLQKYIINLSILINRANEFIVTNILKESLLNSLIEIPIVMLGIYITVISVFGIGFSRATVIISKNGLAEKFIKYTQISIISAIVFLIGTITYDLFSSKLWTFLYLDLIIWCFSNFVRFIDITMKMYSINIKEASKEEKNSEEALSALDKKLNILIDDKENKKFEEDAYFREIQNLNEQIAKESSGKKV